MADQVQRETFDPDEPCVLDEINAVLTKLERGELTAAEQKAVEACRAAVGEALMARYAEAGL